VCFEHNLYYFCLYVFHDEVILFGDINHHHKDVHFLIRTHLCGNEDFNSSGDLNFYDISYSHGSYLRFRQR
jgi:hypothetical protein